MTCTILVVDDHGVFRDGLRSLLDAESGLTVLAEACDGFTAAKLAKQHSPDIVLLDVSLPGMNGLAAAAAIKVECPSTKVIALSMHSDKRYVVGMLEAGAVGYVLKSSDFEELRRAIEAVCQGGTYLSPQIAGVVVDMLVRGAGPEVSPLTSREREVLQLIAEGATTKEVASRLHVSVRTAEGYRAQIMAKLNLRSVAEITKYAVREGITSLDP
jgi:DNA-binding NarL/FixJ family response regulator